MAGSGADLIANEILASLLNGTDFDLDIPPLDGGEYKPPVDNGQGLFKPLVPISTTDLTSGSIEGEGVFDKLMASVKAHLKKEYEDNRISGAEYTKAYIALVGGAMDSASSFLLGKDAAYWSAVNAQIQAQNNQVNLARSRVELETAKVGLKTAQIQALDMSASYALKKMQLAIENVNYALSQQQVLIAKGEVDLIPKKSEMLSAQIAGEQADTDAKKYRITYLLPIEKATSQYNLDTVLPENQRLLIQQRLAVEGTVVLNQKEATAKDKQISILQGEVDGISIKLDTAREQQNVVRAQTSDLRVDGTAVLGVLGKQRSLYDQQITSYKQDAQVKTARIFTEAWTLMKTVDEGLAPPNGFSNANLDAILVNLRTNNNI